MPPADSVSSLTDRSFARRLDVALALACVAISLWLYRDALNAYFSPDDLIYLARARGLVPQPPTLWRYLSGVAYFQLVVPWFGGNPVPYMTANWLLHGCAVALVYGTVRSFGGGRLAATLAAGLFGTSRLFYTVIAQAVTVAEPLSLILGFAALLCARRPGNRWLLASLAIFTAALLCKETVLLVPLLLLLPSQASTPRQRTLRCAMLLAPGALLYGYMSLPSVRSAIFVNQVYERGYGANLFHNWMTLTGWLIDFRSAVPDLGATISTTAWRGSLWLVLAVAAVAILAWRRTQLPAFGLGWWLLTLAPVVPLLHQRYQHYLYVPLAGLAIAIGSGFEWALSGSAVRGDRRPSRSRRAADPKHGGKASPARGGAWVVVGWLLAGGVLIANLLVSDVLLRERARPQLPGIDVPFDPFVRKAELARRAIQRTGAAFDGRRTSVVCVVPESGPGHQLAAILHAILADGRALRAVHPNLDSVAFVPRWDPAYRDFDTVYGRVDGNFVALGRGPEAHVRLAGLLVQDGYYSDAHEDLRRALVVYPANPRLEMIDAEIVRRFTRGTPAAN